MVQTVVAAQLQVPLPASLSVIVLPAHTFDVPVIPAGAAFIVTVVVALQLVGNI